jgi:1-phosphatidylinositol phosphodiesterase
MNKDIVVSDLKGMNETVDGTGVNTAYSAHRWMTDLQGSIGHKKIWQLSLPGAHNSGMDKKASNSNSYITCQHDSFSYQLNSGIRALDIRLKYYQGESTTSLRFRHDHSGTSGRTLWDTMHAVHWFLDANPGEIVILDIHDISTINSPVNYNELHDYLMREHGWKFIPREAVNMTLNEIKAAYPKRRVILAAPSALSNLNPAYIWPKIGHQWAGDGLVSTSRLYSHIESVMKNPPAAGALWSMSATCYSVLGVQGIPSELNSWYRAKGEWQMKSNIINVDFFGSSNLVANCIESNLVK